MGVIKHEIAIPPGTEIYGLAYSDGSAGGWNRDRGAVAAILANGREIGLRPMMLIRLRMKSATLWADA